MIMKSTKDPKEVVVEESSGQVFEEGVTGVRGTRRYVDLRSCGRTTAQRHGLLSLSEQG
jgi:hypothetical protein